MRFMVIVKATAESEAGTLPTREQLTAMSEFNEEMASAGVMLAGEGLQATSKGVRISFSGGRHTVTDGPFTESKELIAGFWLIQVASRQEAVDWISRAPFGHDAEVEIRQLFEVSDFPPEDFAPEHAAREQALRDRLQGSAATP